MEARKVQRVGYSTLAVSLPRDWVSEVNLKRGDLVTFRKEEDGSLRVYPGAQTGKGDAHNYIIHADLCNDPNLLTRIITGSYLLGHDTVQIYAKQEISTFHLNQIRKTSRRLTGISIVEQTMKHVTLQSFVDPTRFPIYGLMRRLQIILISMQDAAVQALLDHRPDLAQEVLHMEEEADRIYWLIVRQLLLAIRDRRIAKEVGIEGFMHILGDRVVTKTFEEMADRASAMAEEYIRLKDRKYVIRPSIAKQLKELNSIVQKLSDTALRALMTKNVKQANEVIEAVSSLEERERTLTESTLSEIEDLALAVGLRTIILNLTQIGKYCETIAEIAMNRMLESPSEVVEWVKVN